MRNVMYFREHCSTDYGVIIVQNPAIPGYAAQGEWENMPGMDGSMWVSDDALEPIDLTVPIWVPPVANVDGVLDWLSGSGDLRFNDNAWTWKAARTSGFLLKPCTYDDGWSATVPFKIQPYRYIYPAVPGIRAVNGQILTNPYTGKALPLINVIGQGDITLMIGHFTILINDLQGEVTLDCSAKVAYSGEYENPNGIIEPVAGWPRLEPGSNTISWTGNAEVTITPRWRSV